MLFVFLGFFLSLLHTLTSELLNQWSTLSFGLQFEISRHQRTTKFLPRMENKAFLDFIPPQFLASPSHRDASEPRLTAHFGSFPLPSLNGESLLIIPQCLGSLICMWLISVWRSCLWSAGRNPDAGVLHNLRDVLEIEFPSPATHEKSVCHTLAPLFRFKTCLFSSWLPQELCVCVCLSTHAHPLFVCPFEL